MSDDIALVEASLERLLATAENPDTAWAELKAAGMTDALLAPERTFATAGAIVKVVARHDASFPLAEAMLVTWLADHAGVDLRGRLPALGLASYPATAELVRSGDDMALDGTLDGVGDAKEGLLCVLPHAGQFWIARLDPVIIVETGRNLAGERRQSLAFDRVALAPGAAVALQMDETRPLLAAAFLRCAQMLGAMERCLSLATRYAAERQQFGRPIMQFQAVQHLCAEIAAGVAAARAAVAHAAAALDRGEGILETAVAKSRIGEIAGAVAAAAHQIHGAIGFTNEYPLGIATRRLWSWRDEYGDETFWNGVVGTAAISWQSRTWANLVDGSSQRDESLKRALAITEYRP